MDLAEQFRPDVIELKIDPRGRPATASTVAQPGLPQLNLRGLYRWNGLEGIAPNGQFVASSPGQFTGWEAGVNFSVPLDCARSVRRSGNGTADHAGWVYLEQALHGASHLLAINYRNLSQYYEQYLAYRRVRQAAEINIEKRLQDNAAPPTL